MNLSPLLDASLAIQIHVATVIPAAIIGAWLLVKRKGTPSHRLLGQIWIVLMALAALSSFFIHKINLVMGLSPIHLLAAYVLYGCVQAVRNVRTGNIRAHRRTVLGMYFGGVVGAGLFTLLPGRVIHTVIFSSVYASAGLTRLGLFFVIMTAAILLSFLFVRFFMARGT